jgi:hypothetical protein
MNNTQIATQNAEKTMSDYLEMDGGIIFNIALYNRFSSIGDSCYSEICGSYIEGVYQWADHNIYSVDEVSNHKYHGWIVNFGSYGTIERKVYIPNWVMEIKPKNFKHAKALFNKYLLQVPAYN